MKGKMLHLESNEPTTFKVLPMIYKGEVIKSLTIRGFYIKGKRFVFSDTMTPLMLELRQIIHFNSLGSIQYAEKHMYSVLHNGEVFAITVGRTLNMLIQKGLSDIPFDPSMTMGESIASSKLGIKAIPDNANTFIRWDRSEIVEAEPLEYGADLVGWLSQRQYDFDSFMERTSFDRAQQEIDDITFHIDGIRAVTKAKGLLRDKRLEEMGI